MKRALGAALLLASLSAPEALAQRRPLVELRPDEVLKAAQHGAGAGESTPLPGPEAIVAAIGRGVSYLIASQNEDGSWGSWNQPAHEFWSNPYSHKAWISATTGLAVMALLEQHEQAAAQAAVERGLNYLLAQPTAQRPSDWDVDNTWSSVYVLDALSTVLAHARYAEGAQTAERRAALIAKAEACVQELLQYQTPTGGWGYYDFDTLAQRPSWATSFETAAALVGLCQARALGLKVPAKMVDRAAAALVACRLPNGAYSYSLDPIPVLNSEWINNVKGSLARIQVGNLALLLAGRPELTHEDILTGLDQFFEHHRFLDVARQKPVPHEAYYLNSGYFYFFGHYYAARLLDHLQPAERARYAARLAREVVKTQEDDGSMWDFYFNTYGPAYGTAFGVMTLTRTLPER
ncbi:MAG: prenyltransferase/squalene oxidase repeat-containing protein [Planctomycetota bacterium]